ncbi:hypothetical protein GRF29_44g2628093, partial [Pseudopithomyces chartarum]
EASSQHLEHRKQKSNSSEAVGRRQAAASHVDFRVGARAQADAQAHEGTVGRIQLLDDGQAAAVRVVHTMHELDQLVEGQIAVTDQLEEGQIAQTRAMLCVRWNGSRFREDGGGQNQQGRGVGVEDVQVGAQLQFDALAERHRRGRRHAHEEDGGIAYGLGSAGLAREELDVGEARRLGELDGQGGVCLYGEAQGGVALAEGEQRLAGRTRGRPHVHHHHQRRPTPGRAKLSVTTASTACTACTASTASVASTAAPAAATTAGVLPQRRPVDLPEDVRVVGTAHRPQVASPQPLRALSRPVDLRCPLLLRRRRPRHVQPRGRRRLRQEHGRIQLHGALHEARRQRRVRHESRLRFAQEPVHGHEPDHTAQLRLGYVRELGYVADREPCVAGEREERQHLEFAEPLETGEELALRVGGVVSEGYTSRYS